MNEKAKPKKVINEFGELWFRPYFLFPNSQCDGVEVVDYSGLSPSMVIIESAIKHLKFLRRKREPRAQIRICLLCRKGWLHKDRKIEKSY